MRVHKLDTIGDLINSISKDKTQEGWINACKGAFGHLSGYSDHEVAQRVFKLLKTKNRLHKYISLLIDKQNRARTENKNIYDLLTLNNKITLLKLFFSNTNNAGDFRISNVRKNNYGYITFDLHIRKYSYKRDKQDYIVFNSYEPITSSYTDIGLQLNSYNFSTEIIHLKAINRIINNFRSEVYSIIRYENIKPPFRIINK